MRASSWLAGLKGELHPRATQRQGSSIKNPPLSTRRRKLDDEVKFNWKTDGGSLSSVCRSAAVAGVFMIAVAALASCKSDTQAASNNGNTAVDHPLVKSSGEAISESAVPPTETGALPVGRTAHLPYFDVTVDDHRRDGATWGAHVRVCYTHRHDSANPDGTTRVSTDPWQFGMQTQHGMSYAKFPTIDAHISDILQPAYGERQLRVGECHAGWVTVVLVEAASGFGGMRYAPSNFDFAATWVW